MYTIYALNAETPPSKRREYLFKSTTDSLIVSGMIIEHFRECGFAVTVEEQWDIGEFKVSKYEAYTKDKLATPQTSEE